MACLKTNIQSIEDSLQPFEYTVLDISNDNSIVTNSKFECYNIRCNL